MCPECAMEKSYKPEGYSEITAYGPDELLATLARPDDLVRVSTILPPIV